MHTRSELELAEADSRIEEAGRNIQMLGSLIPQLADSGYPTDEVEGQVELLTAVLHRLQAERRDIVANMDGHDLPPLIVRSANQAARATQEHSETHHSGSWRALYMRFRIDA
jgi:hypothetical protein